MTVGAVIVLTAVLVAVPCALLGTFLVLRQMSMMGDAISHAVLPGIVFAFFISESVGPLSSLMGASVFGLLTVVLVEALRDTGRVKEDSSIGIVFTALFALGVFLISRFTSSVHLDLEHVLYGEIAYAPLSPLVIGGMVLGPRSLWTLSTVTVLALAIVLLFYKELKATTFDPALAAAVGISPVLVHYVFMGSVSVAIVGAFDSVGAILVVAFLVVPPATAYLLVERLSYMLTLSVTLGIISAVLGYLMAYAMNVAIAGSMALVAGALFVFALLLSPSHGLLARLARARRNRRVFSRDLLLASLDALGGSAPERMLAHRLCWEPADLTRTLSDAARGGFVHLAGGEIRITGSGRETLLRGLRSEAIRH